MEDCKALMIVVKISISWAILVAIIDNGVDFVELPDILVIVHMGYHHATGWQQVVPDTHALLSVLKEIILVLVVVIIDNKCLSILHILRLHTFYRCWFIKDYGSYPASNPFLIG